MHVSPDEHVDVAVERRREEQPLAVRRAVLEERGDDRQEAHVGHPVGLVEDDDLDRVEPCGSAVDEVGEATRRGHDDVDAALQVAHLLADRQAAGDEQDARPRRHGRSASARRRPAWRARGSGRARGRAGGTASTLRWASRASIGRPNASVLPEPVWARPRTSRPATGVGDGRRLDRERLGDALEREALDDRVGQAELAERLGLDERGRLEARLARRARRRERPAGRAGRAVGAAALAADGLRAMVEVRRPTAVRPAGG